jgi:hypothetical protein
MLLIPLHMFSVLENKQEGNSFSINEFESFLETASYLKGISSSV